jgi:hypothetical protein
VGRHTAPDGDGVHPVVAAALERRAADTAGAHRDAVEHVATQRIDGNVGWPGEPPVPGGGLGWPGDLTRDLARGTDRSADPDGVPGHPGGPAARRRGWRRLLRLDRAA